MHETTSPDEIGRLLGESETFATLDERARSFLAERAVVHHFRPEEIIFDTGEDGDRMYVIADGLMRMNLRGPEGDILEIARSGRTGVFGQLAVLDGGKRAARAQAVSPLTLVSFTRDDLFGLIAMHPDVLDGLFRALGNLVRRSAALAGDLAFLDARARLAGRLLQLAGFPEETAALTRKQRVTQSELARMVGTSRQTINNLLHELEIDGSIAIVADGIRIVSAQSLRDLLHPRQ